MKATYHVDLMRCDTATATNEALALEAADLVVRMVRGQKMRTANALFNEFAAAWQFPPYFGENWDAFDECVRDIYQWLQGSRGFIVLILEANAVLADADPEALSLLVEVLRDATATFAEPIEDGESWDRPALVFRVILQAAHADADEAVDRWSAAGATVVVTDPQPRVQGDGNG